MTGKRIAVALMLMALVGVSAQEARTVYIIEPMAEGGNLSDANELWASRMSLPAEAVRLYAPTKFTRKPFTLELAIDGTFSFSSSEKRVLERSDRNTLIAYQVSIRGGASLPKPAKRLTVRFSLADLMKAAEPFRSSPGMFAVNKAILSSGYAKGSAWIESLNYEGNGSFKAVVALRNK